MRDSRSGGMPLSAFLLKPVQRIAKYHLLLKKILDYTPPDYYDFDDLQEAHAKAMQLCEQVNEGVEQRENSQRLEWLQSHVDTMIPGLVEVCFAAFIFRILRKYFIMSQKLTFNSLTNCAGPRRLLFHGSLVKTKSPSKPLWCFLFNDILMITKIMRGSLTDSLLFTDDPKINDLKLKVDGQPYLLDTISAKAVETNASSSSTESITDFTITLVDSNGNTSKSSKPIFELRGRTSVDRNNWVKNINAAIESYLPKQAQSRVKRSMSRKILK